MAAKQLPINAPFVSRGGGSPRFLGEHSTVGCGGKYQALGQLTSSNMEQSTISSWLSALRDSTAGNMVGDGCDIGTKRNGRGQENRRRREEGK